jgi:hydroxymethylglutaryl-CoA lyase
LGGCPFAQDALVGNIPTETVLAALKQRDAQLPSLKPLDALLRASEEIGARYTASQAAD